MTKQEVFKAATAARHYAKKVETMQAMMVEADHADASGDVELCSLLQASVTAMAHSVGKEYGKGFYEIMGDVEGW